MAGRNWTPEEKIRIVLELMNTSTTLADLSRKYSVNPNLIYKWKEKFIDGGKLALSGGIRDPAREKDAEIEMMKKLIGELTIANDAMKKVLTGEGKKMSVKIMISNGLSARKAMHLAGTSQGSYYCKKRKNKRNMKDKELLPKAQELSLRKPMYGTRMMAAYASRELNRPVNRKAVKHAFRLLGWNRPQLKKRDLIKASDGRQSQAG